MVAVAGSSMAESLLLRTRLPQTAGRFLLRKGRDAWRGEHWGGGALGGDQSVDCIIGRLVYDSSLSLFAGSGTADFATNLLTTSGGGNSRVPPTYSFPTISNEKAAKFPFLTS